MRSDRCDVLAQLMTLLCENQMDFHHCNGDVTVNLLLLSQLDDSQNGSCGGLGALVCRVPRSCLFLLEC